MNKLQQLRGTYFAIKVNNNLDEITEILTKEGFVPDNEWNDEMVEDNNNITHVIVYENLIFEFHTHDGFSEKTIEL